MKVGIVTEYFYPTLGGITENVFHMASKLIAQGVDVRIITGKKGGQPCPDKEIASRVINIGHSVPTFFNGSCGVVTVGFGLSRKMRNMLAVENFDLLHLHSPIFPTLPPIANMRFDGPMAATYHTCTNNTLLYRFFKPHIQRLIDRIDLNIAVSNLCAEENRRFFDADFKVIPNGVDVEWWACGKKIPKFDDGKINVVFLGRPDERNGLDKLITAFARLRRKMKNIRLIVVGDGPLAFFFQNLVPNDVREDVFFEGPSVDRRRDYLKTAHIMCFCPSIASFGITILEGMSAGKALIASDIGPFRELVTNEESALLVDPGDVHAIESAIQRLALSEELREKLGATASERVLHYDWNRVVKLQMEMYKSII